MAVTCNGLYSSGIVGHRGASASAPENTLASVRKAAQDGARMVEVDARLSGDGRAMILHDAHVDRTTDGTGVLAELTFETVRELDAGSWFGEAFRGEPIPTLEDLVETVNNLGLGLNLEIKATPESAAETTWTTLTTAAACWARGSVPVISSFSQESLTAARDWAEKGEVPDWPRALLLSTLTSGWEETAAHLAVRALHLGDDALREEDVRAVKARGYAAAVWTVNDPERGKLLRRWGADALITDSPGVMIAAGA